MIRRPPRATLTDTLFPYTTLFRSTIGRILHHRSAGCRRSAVLGREMPGCRLWCDGGPPHHRHGRSEEHTSELQSLMRISYDVFCLKKKTENYTNSNKDDVLTEIQHIHHHNSN